MRGWFWRALKNHNIHSLLPRGSAARALSKMPCSEVTEAVSPQKRCKSDAVNGHEEQKVLKFAKLTENATTPSRGSNRAAGFDLYRWFSAPCTRLHSFVHVFRGIMWIKIFRPAESTWISSGYCWFNACDDVIWTRVCVCVSVHMTTASGRWIKLWSRLISRSRFHTDITGE